MKTMNHTFIMVGALLIGLSFCSSKPLTRQEQVYETTVFRLGWLRSGGVAVLPIRIALPPSVVLPPFRLQQRLEQSMTEALMKLHKDIRVVPPAKTLNFLGKVGADTARVERVFPGGDSLAVDRDTLVHVRERTGSRFIMQMVLTSDGWSPSQNPGVGDPTYRVVCQIWDTHTGAVVWRAQHPWSISATYHSDTVLQQLCTDLLTQIPR